MEKFHAGIKKPESKRNRPGRAMNDRQVKFIEQYVVVGDVGVAASLAGYEAKTEALLRATGYRLRRELQSEISAAMEGLMYDKGPKALQMVEDLMKTSKSDTVRLAAAKDLLDRSGFKPRERIVTESQKLSTPELESRIIGLVGREVASQLLNKLPKPGREEAEAYLQLPKIIEEEPATVN